MDINHLWEIVRTGGPIGLLFLFLLAIIFGKLVPQLHHDWALDVLKTDRDEWKAHAKDLKNAVERLAAVLEGRTR